MNTDKPNESLLDETVATFLDRLASRSPTPGGGAVAALSGALACALARMVHAYRPSKKGDAHADGDDEPGAMLGRADAALRRLMDEDARAYADYSSLRKEKDAAPDHQRRLQQALALCASVPLEIAAISANTLEVLEGIAPNASRYLLSDLEAAAILCEATVRCAGCSVRVNARLIEDQAAATELVDQLERMQASAARRLDAVNNVLSARL